MDEILKGIEEGLRRKGLSAAAASQMAAGNPSVIKNLMTRRGLSKAHPIENLIAVANVLGLELYLGPPRAPVDDVPFETVVEATKEALEKVSEQARLAGREPLPPVPLSWVQQAARQALRLVETGSGVPANDGVVDDAEAEFAPVPIHEATLAAGPGRENDREAVIGQLAFRRDWLQKMGVSPNSAAIVRVEGESMTPTIHPGDMVLIDTARTEVPMRPRNPKDRRPSPIYALVDDQQARVKRLEPLGEGRLALLSDNPSFAPELRAARDLRIIGKVLWWGHTNRE